MTTQPPRFEPLPYLETIDAVAAYILEMAGDNGDFYMPGIRASYDSMEFSQGQIGLLDKYASPKLSAKLEKHLCGEKTEEIPAHLEQAFWAPVLSAAQQILNPQPMGDMNVKQARNLCVGILYAALQANIQNMALMVQLNQPQHGNASAASDNSSDLTQKFAARNPYQIHTDMPVEHIMQVLKKGVIPQFTRAIHQEMGLDGNDMAGIKNALHKMWAEDDSKIAGNMLLRPLDIVEWMRFGRLDQGVIADEITQAIRDSRRLLPPPFVPEP